MSVLRAVRKRKKVRKLGAIDIIRREAYADLELDAKVELIRALVPLGLLHVQELLDQEVTVLAGARYARKDESVEGRRHGSNPGTVGLAGQRVPIRVPRLRHIAGSEIPLRSYEAMRGDRDVDDLLLRRVLYGISCRNYEAAAAVIPGAIGLSSSTVSRGFIQASAAQLRAFQERDLSGEDVVAMFLDGKTFADATMVIALGITMAGEKRFLGFVETDTENATVLTPFLRSLVERGLDLSQGVLVILDGGKGLRTAVRKAFRNRALVHRCQWHKRENVVSHLAKHEQAAWRQRLQRAYNRPDYDEALGALETLLGELDERNQSAAGSLAEGLDETLTLHRRRGAGPVVQDDELSGVCQCAGRGGAEGRWRPRANATASAPSADRRPDGELALSGRAPCQQQIREVRRRDQQHEADGGHQGNERRPHFAHHLVLETDQTQRRRLTTGPERIQASDDGLAFGFRLCKRDTVGEPGDAGEGHNEPLAGTLLPRRQAQRDPDLGLAVRKVEALRHDTDDGMVDIIEPDQTAENVRVTIVTRLPPGVAQHGDRLSSRRFLVLGEHPAKQRCRAQQREERGRHRGAPNPDRLGVIQVGERAVTVPGNLVYGLRVLAPCLQRGARHERRHFAAAKQRALFPHPNQTVGIRVRQRTQQRGVDHTKHGCRGPDTQCEGGQCHDREPGALDQHPQAVSHVLEESIHSSDVRTLSCRLFVTSFSSDAPAGKKVEATRAPQRAPQEPYVG